MKRSIEEVAANSDEAPKVCQEQRQKEESTIDIRGRTTQSERTFDIFRGEGKS